jgi:hypothetical protein
VERVESEGSGRMSGRCIPKFKKQTREDAGAARRRNTHGGTNESRCVPLTEEPNFLNRAGVNDMVICNARTRASNQHRNLKFNQSDVEPLSSAHAIRGSIDSRAQSQEYCTRMLDGKRDAPNRANERFECGVQTRSGGQDHTEPTAARGGLPTVRKTVGSGGPRARPSDPSSCTAMTPGWPGWLDFRWGLPNSMIQTESENMSASADALVIDTLWASFRLRTLPQAPEVYIATAEFE